MASLIRLLLVCVSIIGVKSSPNSGRGVLISDCPSNNNAICSGHGNCGGHMFEDGISKCECHDGFLGDDCSQVDHDLLQECRLVVERHQTSGFIPGSPQSSMAYWHLEYEKPESEEDVCADERLQKALELNADLAVTGCPVDLLFCDLYGNTCEETSEACADTLDHACHQTCDPDHPCPNDNLCLVDLCWESMEQYAYYKNLRISEGDNRRMVSIGVDMLKMAIRCAVNEDKGETCGVSLALNVGETDVTTSCDRGQAQDCCATSWADYIGVELGWEKAEEYREQCLEGEGVPSCDLHDSITHIPSLAFCYHCQSMEHQDPPPSPPYSDLYNLCTETASEIPQTSAPVVACKDSLNPLSCLFNNLCRGETPPALGPGGCMSSNPYSMCSGHGSCHHISSIEGVGDEEDRRVCVCFGGFSGWGCEISGDGGDQTMGGGMEEVEDHVHVLGMAVAVAGVVGIVAMFGVGGSVAQVRVKSWLRGGGGGGGSSERGGESQAFNVQNPMLRQPAGNEPLSFSSSTKA